MIKYPSIQTVYLRDPFTKFKTLLDKQFAIPEFEYLKNNMWVFTEKVNGTNIRIILEEGEKIRFAGRTDKAQIPMYLLRKLEEIFFPLEHKLIKMFSAGTCLYGEGFGGKIQKEGENYLKDNDFALFDIKVGDWWLMREDLSEIANKLGITQAPVVGEGTLHYMVEKVRCGFKSEWGDFIAEGVVATPKIDLLCRSGNRIITKLKYNDFGRN